MVDDDDDGGGGGGVRARISQKRVHACTRICARHAIPYFPVLFRAPGVHVCGIAKVTFDGRTEDGGNGGGELRFHSRETPPPPPRESTSRLALSPPFLFSRSAPLSEES